MFLYKLCKALTLAKVPYAIVGGYAVALHGAVRGTIDVDVAINWTLQNLEKIEKTLKGLGLVSRIPIDANNLFYFRDEYIKNRNLIAWNFFDPSNPINQVDIVINYDLKDANITIVKTAFGNVKILSKADLIKMKMQSGRPQDIEDVKTLENL